MRTLRPCRHTLCAKPGQHLTQSGVTLARRVGESIRIMGAIDAVIEDHGGWPCQVGTPGDCLAWLRQGLIGSVTGVEA
jgi:hypothetical protein